MEQKLNFGQALESLKEGKKVYREGWNGKNMWLKLNNWTSQGIAGIITSDGKENPIVYGGQIGHTIDDDGTAYYNHNWIGMKTADNKFVPWLASQTDVLAEDWRLLI